MVDESDYILDDCVGRVLKVLRRLVVGINHSLDGAVEQRFSSRGILHEVEDEDVVEVAVDLVHVFEVDPVVQLCEFEDDFDDFGFVVAAEAAVGSSTEDSFAALEDEVWANRVLRLVESLVEGLLLGQKDYCSVVFQAAWRRVATLLNSVDDVSPDVWRVVTVEVNDLLLLSLRLSVLIGTCCVHFKIPKVRGLTMPFLRHGLSKLSAANIF